MKEKEFYISWWKSDFGRKELSFLEDKFLEDRSRFRLVLLLQEAHALAVEGLRDQVALRFGVPDDLPVDLDGGIEIAFYFLGVKPFAQKDRRRLAERRRRAQHDDQQQ